MRILPKSEPPALMLRSQPGSAVAGIDDPSRPIIATVMSRFFGAPEICPVHERHVRRPGWTELFFDLVFAAAIAQLSGPLSQDYSLYGIARFAFLLALI